MTLSAISALLQAAISLLSFIALHPTLSQSVRAQGMDTAQQAITLASQAFADYTVSSPVAAHSSSLSSTNAHSSVGAQSVASSATAAASVSSTQSASSALYCTFGSQTIRSGQSVTAYQSASVSSGSRCVSETRTCLNGILIGSYTHSSCLVVPVSSADASASISGSSSSSDASTALSSQIQAGLQTALSDLLSHFWTGSNSSGHVLPTWDGIVGDPLTAPSGHTDPRGDIWHAGTLLDVLYTQYLINPSSANAQPILAEWNYLKSVFTESDLTQCGGSSAENFWADDSGWNAASYLEIYNVSHDAYALQSAESLVRCAYNRWWSYELGGGLWYNDDKNSKSLYDAGLALDALRIYQITGDTTYLTYAKEEYDWMQQYLFRSDNLYWTDYGWWAVSWDMENHSTVAAHPLDSGAGIQLANSVSYLGGNMGMDTLDALFYRLTGDPVYLQRTRNTAAAILSTYTDSTGAFLDDRDAGTNAHFLRDWIVEVYPLLPLSSQQKMLSVIQTTAREIIANDRSSDGYYGGCWSGPLTGCAWNTASSGSYTPQHIYVSATAAEFIAGPSLLASKLSPTLLTQVAQPTVSASFLGRIGKDVVGETTVGANGVIDEQIKLSGVSVPLSQVRISSPNGPGVWQWPSNGRDWILSAQPESDSTIVDLYFDYFQPYSSYILNLTFSNGITETINVQ